MITKHQNWPELARRCWARTKLEHPYQLRPEVLLKIKRRKEGAPKTATVELHIDEVMELISYNQQCGDAFPKEAYSTLSMAGTTFGENAQKRYKRSRELRGLLNRVWPK